MTRSTFQVSLPSSLLDLGFSQGEIQRLALESLLLSLFADGKISSGKAGKLLGITRFEFIKLLGKRGIPYFNYDEDELAKELETLKELDLKK